MWTAVVLAVSLSPAAPAPAPQPARPATDKWEYCEVYFNSRAAAMNLGRGGAGGPGGAGGVVVPVAVPGRVVARLVSATEEVEATSWEDLANKLKLPPGR